LNKSVDVDEGLQIKPLVLNELKRGKTMKNETKEIMVRSNEPAQVAENLLKTIIEKNLPGKQVM
jgi:hypothetical protein